MLTLRKIGDWGLVVRDWRLEIWDWGMEGSRPAGEGGAVVAVGDHDANYYG